MIRLIKIIIGIFRLRCPRCRQAPLFSNPHLFHLSEVHKMPDNCPKCGQDFVIEEQFYWGAMFVSYALTAVFLLSITGIDILLTGYLPLKRLLVYISIMLLLWTYMFRLSRAVWITLFVRYKEDAVEQHRQQLNDQNTEVS